MPPTNLTATETPKASKIHSQSSKSPKVSLLSRLKNNTFGKCRRKKPDTPQRESERGDDKTSSAVVLSAAEPLTVEGSDAIASISEPASTPASAPAATASDTGASGPVALASDTVALDASASATSATRSQPAAYSSVPFSSPEHTAADAAVLNREQSEASTSKHANINMKNCGEMSLWNKACASLKARDENSKYVSKVIEFHSFGGTLRTFLRY